MCCFGTFLKSSLVWWPVLNVSMVSDMQSFRIFAFHVSVLLILVTLPSGCVQRRMTIRSTPPGALVYVDDYQIGTTPVSTDFVYYGTRKIRLIKDGYETLTVSQPFPLPWYQIFPLDFVTENIWPGEIRDERVVDLSMMPAAATPPEEVVSRAEVARLAAGGGSSASLSVPQPAPVPATLPLPPPQPNTSVPPQTPAPLSGPVFPGMQNPGMQVPIQNSPQQGVPSLGVP